MIQNLTARALIPSWSSHPIPHLNLSTGGLLALADLQTIARRTALTGGSSWLDALVLAPGLHYQQACDSLDHEDGPAWLDAVEDGGQVRHAIRNVVTLNYLRALLREGNGGLGGDVTIDIGMVKQDIWRSVKRAVRWGRKRLDELDDEDLIDVDWLSHALYIMSPLLTLSAITLSILLTDFWALGFILALMLSRILNIWAIKHRSLTILPIPSNPSIPPDRHTEYTVLGTTIRLRGLDTDLQALTTSTWLRAKSHLDGYAEACAKLIVYLVAALSGNLTQAGALVLVCLLLVSAALLGLSNAHARGFWMHGRYAVPKVERREEGEKMGRSTGVERELEGGEGVRGRVVSEAVSQR